MILTREPLALNNATTELKISEDTRGIFDRELLDNISENVGQTSGYIVCRRGLRSKGIKTYVNQVVSYLTLGIANVFGYTYATHRDELEIVVDIYDMNDTVVASYNAIGYGEADEKLYNGYITSDARRLAHARAFSDAMDGILTKIGADSERISKLLTE